jgi:hypothetical protein
MEEPVNLTAEIAEDAERQEISNEFYLPQSR